MWQSVKIKARRMWSTRGKPPPVELKFRKRDSDTLLLSISQEGMTKILDYSIESSEMVALYEWLQNNIVNGEDTN